MGDPVVKLDRSKNLVSYSRNLAEARYYLSPTEQKLVWAMCSLINSKDDEDFQTYKVDVSSLAEYIGMDKKSAIRELDRVTDSLMSRVLRIPVDDGQNLLKLHWVSHCLISEKCVEFSFHPKMKPYLLKLRKQFGSHRFNTIVSFRGGYTIRLYQLLKVYLYEGKYRCSVEELREILEVGDAYREFKEFKRNVLLPAKREFEKKNKETGGYMSDLTFELEMLKTGRRITDLVFHIKKQSYQEILPLELPPVKQEGASPALEALEHYGIKGEKAKQYLDQQEETEILRCVALLEKAKKKSTVKSESGYLLKLLDARAGQETEAEKQEKNKQQQQEEQSRKVTEEEKRRDTENRLSNEFFRQERGTWLTSLTPEEQGQKLKEAQESMGGGFSAGMVKGLESPLIMEFVKSQIKDYDSKRAAYLQEHMK